MMRAKFLIVWILLSTLIIWGAEDRIIPVEHAYAAHAAIPGSWLEIIEGVGHYSHCEAPDRFVNVAETALRFRHWGGGSRALDRWRHCGGS